MNTELMLLNIISEEHDLSQRDLAKRMDLSLGTVNNMLQSFENLQYLTMQKISSRQVAYYLTSEGKKRHNELYVSHISECFDTVSVIRKTFKDKLTQLVDEGKQHFYIDGHTDELIRLAKMCFFELSRKTPIEYKVLKELNHEEVQHEINSQQQQNKVIVGWETKDRHEEHSLDYINLLS